MDLYLSVKLIFPSALKSKLRKISKSGAKLRLFFENYVYLNGKKTFFIISL